MHRVSDQAEQGLEVVRGPGPGLDGREHLVGDADRSESTFLLGPWAARRPLLEP